MGDKRPILNDFLQRVLTQHASKRTSGHLSQTIDSVQTAQLVSQSQAITDPVKDDNWEVELYVVPTDADLRVFQHLSLLVDLNDWLRDRVDHVKPW